MRNYIYKKIWILLGIWGLLGVAVCCDFNPWVFAVIGLLIGISIGQFMGIKDRLQFLDELLTLAKDMREGKFVEFHEDILSGLKDDHIGKAIKDLLAVSDGAKNVLEDVLAAEKVLRAGDKGYQINVDKYQGNNRTLVESINQILASK